MNKTQIAHSSRTGYHQYFRPHCCKNIIPELLLLMCNRKHNPFQTPCDPMILLISRKLITYTKGKVSRAFPELCSRLLSHPCCKPYYINIFANILNITYTNPPTPQRSQTDYDKQQSRCLSILLENVHSLEYN